jgi:hypothetical protein
MLRQPHSFRFERLYMFSLPPQHTTCRVAGNIVATSIQYTGFQDLQSYRNICQVLNTVTFVRF